MIVAKKHLFQYRDNQLHIRQLKTKRHLKDKKGRVSLNYEEQKKTHGCSLLVIHLNCLLGEALAYA